jgi:hypothetical protein
MAGPVAFPNPNPVEIATYPNQKLRSNLRSDGGEEGGHYPNPDYLNSFHSPADNGGQNSSPFRDDRNLRDGENFVHSHEFNSPVSGDRAADHHESSCIEPDDGNVSAEQGLTLFLKRDIPAADEDQDTHVALTQLWELRQKASSNLVQALNEDDSDLFDRLEELMRKFNQRMHAVYNKYRKNASNPEELPVSSSRDQDPTRTTIYDETDEGDIQIKLDYNGVQVIRRVKGKTLTRVVYHLAQQYLREVFALRVDNLSDLLLLHCHREVPVNGTVGDIPILDGDELMVMFRRWGNTNRTQKQPDLRFDDDDLDGGPSDGNHADYHREERHDLNHARAPSQPGTNGGASPSDGNHADYHREERHDLNHARASSRPGNNGEAYNGNYRLLYNVSTPHPSHPATPRKGRDYPGQVAVGDESVGARSFDKIRQSFKCPRFTGQCKEWKQWNKGFMRYLSIWELEHVLDCDFLDEMPLTPVKKRDNKMVYFIIEDAVQHSPLAASYVRQAPVNNGFEAYYTLHDGFVFAGTTTATLLLNELSNFRFLPDETPTALCLRLEELFEELELLPGNAAVTFVDTQRIGYLINALRHESEWDNVCSTITSSQIKGDITFRQACNELRFRCETARAHDLLDKPVKGKRVKGLGAKATEQDEQVTVSDQVTAQVSGLISTMAKRLNVADDVSPGGDKKGGKKKYVKKECLAAECDQITTFSLCGLHYHSLISGKTPTLKLRNGYGDATYDGTTSLIVYPARTPTDRLPPSKKVKAALADTKQ